MKIHTHYTVHTFCIGIGSITISYLKRSAQLWKQWIARRLTQQTQPPRHNETHNIIRPCRRYAVLGSITRGGQARGKGREKNRLRTSGPSSRTGISSESMYAEKAKPCIMLRPSRRPIPYRRLGEASHPGPIIRMPGDGHCLYHALGWWASLTQSQVRNQLASVDWGTWRSICPWDNGAELTEFRRETRDPSVWGGAIQIAVCAAIHQVNIEVDTDFGKQTFGNGQRWGLRHTSHPAGHYDVFTSDSQPTRMAKPTPQVERQTTDKHAVRSDSSEKLDTQARPDENIRATSNDGSKATLDSYRPSQWKKPTTRLGGKKTHVIRSVNVNGSREAMLNAFAEDGSILLIQEHRLLGCDLPGMQAIAHKAGWHGVWDAATRTLLRGRSGGTAVLTRLPGLIFRGHKVHRTTTAIIPWTRHTAMHLVAVYGAHSLHHDRDAENGRMLDEIQEHLAVIGRVPWICAGDWNMEPNDFEQIWSRAGRVRHTAGPTHQFGGNLDWFLTSPQLQLSEPKAQAMPGTDHVAVWAALAGDQAATLGYRLVSPRGFTTSQLKEAKAKLEGQADMVPDNWTTWTRKAEKLIRDASGDKLPGNTGRGQHLRYAKQRLARPQVGDMAYGGNSQIMHLRKLQCRINRANQLEALGRKGTFEDKALQRKLGGRAKLTEQEEHILATWEKNTESHRRKLWREWVQEQMAKGGGKLYRWARRAGEEPGLTTLEAKPEAEDNIAGRLHHARQEWPKYWDGGKPWLPRHHNTLEPITGDQVRKVLQRLKGGKAKGPDGWGPKELEILPNAWTDRLAIFYNQWEAKGHWPPAIRRSVIALIAKQGAATEAQLRPIGILSYVYRIWMAIRKQDTRQWSLQIHGGKHQGAAALACHTRAQVELAAWKGQSVLMALLDCSKCYERVEHLTAAQRAVDSGCPDTVVNMSMDIYSARRLIRVHGAVARPTAGHHGLIAGCSFAKDYLKSFLGPIAKHATSTNFRDYVDDMVLIAKGDNPGQAAAKLEQDLIQIKNALAADNMVLNDAKQQIYGPTAADRKAWQELTGQAAIGQVKDLGVWHYGYGYKHPLLDSKLQELRTTASRIGNIPIPRERKATMAAAIVYGRCLYGQEAHFLTARHFQKMRSIMCKALGDKHAHRPQQPLLLHLAGGKFEPEVVRMNRLVRHWIKNGPAFQVPHDYWQDCKGSISRRGPIHLMVHTLEAYGIQAIGPLCWELKGRVYDLQNQHGIQEEIAQHVTDTLWARLATRRTAYQGMAQGRDECATNSWRSTLEDDRNVAFLDIILTDGVYTPMRAHMRWGKTPECPFCQAQVADWKHFVKHCPAMPNAPPHQAMPDSLVYTGNVPKGYVAQARSAEMQQDEKWQWTEQQDGTTTVATDGGCVKTPAGPRAGWGYATDNRDMPGRSGPAKGPWQTAQRGEVLAVAHALCAAPTAIHILTDSKYVANTLERMAKGGHPKGRHADLWNIIWGLKAKLEQVTWVKAHLTKEQAKLRGICPKHWELNRQADLRATEGLQKHTEDPGAWTLREWGIRRVAEWQKHLVKIYLQVRKAGLQGPSPSGITRRFRPLGPRPAPRKTRTDGQWQKHHVIAKHKGGDACLRCGRTTVAARQGKLQQWRRRCAALKGHAKRLANRHRLIWTGRWECSHCPLVGAKLAMHGCLGKHPTGKKRYTAKQRPFGTESAKPDHLAQDRDQTPSFSAPERSLGPPSRHIGPGFGPHCRGSGGQQRSLLHWAAAEPRRAPLLRDANSTAQGKPPAKKARVREEGSHPGIRAFFSPGQANVEVFKRPRTVSDGVPPAHLTAGVAKRPKA